MHSAASNSLIFTDLSSFKRSAELGKQISHAGLYQGIAQNLIRGFHTEQALANFSNILVTVADHAYLMRQLHIVASVGQLLVSMPVFPELESLGRYYEALYLNRRDAGDTARAEYLFAQVADKAPISYRARAMLALGTNQVAAGNHICAASFYRDVMGIVTRGRAFDPVTFYFAAQMTAVARSTEGDHRGALTDLESLVPLVRSASARHPYTYFDYLNSLAVELGEVGRLEEARRASEIALRSQYSKAYPNWRETFDDIVAKQQRASRSIIAVPECSRDTHPPSSAEGRGAFVQHPRESRNLVRLPAPGVAANASAGNQRSVNTPGRVLNFEQWKTLSRPSSGPLPARLSTEQREQMTTSQKLIRLMDLVSRDETDDETIDRILEAVEEIVLSRPKAKLD